MGDFPLIVLFLLIFLEDHMDTSNLSLDTASVLAVAGVVLAAYGAIWAINKVISVIKK